MRSESTGHHEHDGALDSGEVAPGHRMAHQPRGSSGRGGLDLLAWLLLIGLSLLLLSVTGVAMYLMDRQGDKAVVGVQPAGQVLAVTPMSGFFANAMVETTLGFYAVSGEVGLLKGEELVLQTRANRRRSLCDTSQHCMPLR